MSEVVATGTAVVAAIREANAVLKELEKEGIIERIKERFGMGKPKPRVLVLGASGAGKTNLLASLKRELPSDIDRLNRTEVSDHHKIKLHGQPFDFIDTPGEMTPDAKKERGKAVVDALNGGLAGVIHVVSYGYHEHRTGAKNEALTAEHKAKDEWLLQHLEQEIAMLAENVGRIDASWFFTVISKADLWWGQRDEARSWYAGNGIVKDYKNVLDHCPIRRTFVSEYCSVIKRFWEEGLVDGTFDDIQRIKLRYSLIRDLLAAVGKEA